MDGGGRAMLVEQGCCVEEGEIRAHVPRTILSDGIPLSFSALIKELKYSFDRMIPGSSCACARSSNVVFYPPSIY